MPRDDSFKHVRKDMQTILRSQANAAQARKDAASYANNMLEMQVITWEQYQQLMTEFKMDTDN